MTDSRGGNQQAPESMNCPESCRSTSMLPIGAISQKPTVEYVVAPWRQIGSHGSGKVVVIFAIVGAAVAGGITMPRTVTVTAPVTPPPAGPTPIRSENRHYGRCACADLSVRQRSAAGDIESFAAGPGLYTLLPAVCPWTGVYRRYLPRRHLCVTASLPQGAVGQSVSDRRA